MTREANTTEGFGDMRAYFESYGFETEVTVNETQHGYTVRLTVEGYDLSANTVAGLEELQGECEFYGYETEFKVDETHNVVRLTVEAYNSEAESAFA